jgi:hypothetical protein
MARFWYQVPEDIAPQTQAILIQHRVKRTQHKHRRSFLVTISFSVRLLFGHKLVQGSPEAPSSWLELILNTILNTLTQDARQYRVQCPSKSEREIG